MLLFFTHILQAYQRFTERALTLYWSVQLEIPNFVVMNSFVPRNIILVDAADILSLHRTLESLSVLHGVKSSY